MQAQEKKIHTPEDYLDFEVNSEIRHEYINGEIIPMTGGTPNHNDIAGNLYILIKLALKEKAYRTFYVDQRLWVPDYKFHTYPDVMVVSKPIELQAGRKDTVINPVLIAEVLSKSTKNYDKDEKFVAYCTIPTFREYLLIDQYTPRLQRYTKNDSNQWIFREYDGIKASFELISIPCTISLAEIYSDIKFEAK